MALTYQNKKYTKEELEHCLDRAAIANKLKNDKAWQYLVEYCNKQIKKYSDIKRLNSLNEVLSLMDESKLKYNFIQAVLHIDIYEGFKNILDRWIKDGERAKEYLNKKEAKNGR